MTADMHMLTGAYALDALDADERSSFEAHIASCDSCAEEVGGLRATGAMLGLAAAAPPDASFKRRVMAQVRVTRQQTPRPGSGSAAVVPLVLRRAQTTSRVLLAVAAALVVVAGTLGGLAVHEQRRATQLQQAAAAVTSVLSAPDARVISGRGDQGSTARAVLSPSRRSVVFVGQTMPDVDADHALQLWVLGNGDPKSVGLIDPTQPIVAHGVTTGQKLGVTVEPAGGSPAPTTSPIMQIDLA